MEGKWPVWLHLLPPIRSFTERTLRFSPCPGSRQQTASRNKGAQEQKEVPEGGLANTGADARAWGVLLPCCALSTFSMLPFPVLSPCHFLPLSSRLSQAFVLVFLLPLFSPSALYLFLSQPISGLFNSL